MRHSLANLAMRQSLAGVCKQQWQPSAFVAMVNGLAIAFPSHSRCSTRLLRNTVLQPDLLHPNSDTTLILIYRLELRL